MALFSNLALLAEQLATEPSRLKKRAAIAAAIAQVAYPSNDLSSFAAGGGSASPAAPPSPSDTPLDPQSLTNAGLFALYLAGQPFPEADPRKLNTGGALLTRALLTVSHATDAVLTAAYRRHGDLGAAAFDLLENRLSSFAEGGGPASPTHTSIPTLTLAELATAFDSLATARTTASRSSTVIDLLRRATPLEAKYLLKLMLGDMRIGVKQSLIEEAIAIASATELKDVRHAVMLEADLAHTVLLAFTHTLANARMRLFHPLGFMLASPVDTPEEAIARFTPKPNTSISPHSERSEEPPYSARTNPNLDSGHDHVLQGGEPNPLGLGRLESHRPSGLEGGFSPLSTPHQEGASAPALHAFIEDKYDGMRAQLHCGDPLSPKRVALYSRNREDITASFPELAEAFAHITEPLILDGEILAWDFANNKALPFAILGQRIGRKKIDDALRRDVPVIFMAFDLLFQNDDLLLDRPLHQRRHRLEALAKELSPLTLSPVEQDTSSAAQQISMFAHPDSTPNPPVQRLFLSPARLVESAEAIEQAYGDARLRANEGVMLKSAESTYQPGRRGLAWLKLKRELATLDVVITGAEYGHGKRAGLLSDYTFAVQDQAGNLLNVGKAYSGLTDIEINELTTFLETHTLEDQGHFRTVEPLIILEVAFNNIMRSPRHSSGFALRFPRILHIRNDKPLSEIDTLARVEEIYQSQPDR